MRLLLTLPLLIAACADETVSGYADPDATYRLTHIDDRAFAAMATVSFPEKGIARGNGPCNQWSAKQTAPYPWLSLEQAAVTERACPDLAAEQTFFDTLFAMTLAEVQGATLILSNDDGTEMTFTTAP